MCNLNPFPTLKLHAVLILMLLFVYISVHIILHLYLLCILHHGSGTLNSTLFYSITSLSSSTMTEYISEELVLFFSSAVLIDHYRLISVKK